MKRSLASTIVRYVILGIAIAINIFIMVNAFIEGAKSSEFSNGASEVWIKVIEEASPGTFETEASKESFKQFFRKFAGHFCLFGLNGIFSSIAFYLFLRDVHTLPRWSIHLISGVFGFIMAMLSELAQVPTNGRSGSMRDVIIDTSGYLLGLLAVLIVVLIVEFNLRNVQKKQVE